MNDQRLPRFSVCCTALCITLISAYGLGEDIRKHSHHFNLPGGDISPWVFVPADNVKEVSTTHSPGLVTVWEAGKGEDIKGILEEPIRLDEYDGPWEFQLAFSQNFSALAGLTTQAIGINVVVTFSDPSTWPSDRTELPADARSVQLFVVNLAKMPQFAPYPHDYSFFVWGRGNLHHTLTGNWNIPSVWIGDGAQYGGPASNQVFFRFAVNDSDSQHASLTTLSLGIKFDPQHGWNTRAFHTGEFGSVTGIWQIGPILSCDRWIPDELCANLPRAKGPHPIWMGNQPGNYAKNWVPVESRKPEQPSPAHPYYIDYCVFLRSRPIPFEQYSDDFNIRGFMGQWITQEQSTLIETYSHPGYMTWTLLGPSLATGIAPVGGDLLNLDIYEPPWEMEVCFSSPDDTIPWNFFMNFQMKTNKGRKFAWHPGVQNLPDEKRHAYVNHGFSYGFTTSPPSNAFHVEFPEPVPEEILRHKPLYMLLQWLDRQHVRVGFKALPDDPWHFSEIYDYSVNFQDGEELDGNFIQADWTTSTGKDWGGMEGCPIYQQILIDYVDYRYGTTSEDVTSEAAEPRPAAEAPLSLEPILPPGDTYEATVPDTLDLAERARLSVHNLTSNIEPEKFYAVYQSYPIYEKPDSPAGLTWTITVKNARTLPYLRTMCGSDENIDVERNIMKALLSEVAADGVMYYPFGGHSAPEGTAYPVVNGLMALAVKAWHERDGNPAWDEHFRSLCRGLKKMAIRVEDRAYYPPESGFRSDGTWHWNTRGEAKIPYTPPEEPHLDWQGLEGAVKWEHSHGLRALVKDYVDHDDRDSLELARALTRFCLKETLWEDTSKLKFPGFEHGFFAGHFHGNVTALHALLEYALATNDNRLKQIVREGYDHGRQIGVVRMGWFPCWYLGDKYHRPGFAAINEACGASDMLLLAVKLTDAGLGDYWDDVDTIIRNHLTEMQATDMDLMNPTGNESYKEKLSCFVGGFGDGGPTGLTRGINGCCSANGAMGLYYAWHGITRFDRGVATVNLFLNRSSRWMDIDSYLPYEGKVVLRNKLAHTALVRIPGWIDRNSVEVLRNDAKTECRISGNYIHLGHLLPGEILTVNFQVEEGADQYSIAGKEYTMTYRGSTVTDISPRQTGDKIYPYYTKKGMGSKSAPLRKVTRFAAKKVLSLQ